MISQKRRSQTNNSLLKIVWILLCVQVDELSGRERVTSINDSITISSSLHTTEQTSLTHGQDESNQPTLRMVTNCQTPNGDEGYCMPIQNCSKLYNELGNDYATEFLRNSYCGPKKQNVAKTLVCCGTHSNYKSLLKGDVLPKRCGYQDVAIKGRIYGGKEAALGEFPWLARLIHKHSSGLKQFGCTGFLVTPTFIVTAGHCLKSDNIDVIGPLFEVQLGEHNTKTKKDCNEKKTVCADKPQVMRIKSIIPHPLWDMRSKDHHNDIGLIHLKKAARFTKYVTPICLADTTDEEAFEYWVSGWGTTENEALSSIKLKVSLRPANLSECSQKYQGINIELNNNQLCAGGQKSRDSCTGDSGGPLMQIQNNTWFAAGVVSYGLGCGRVGWPGVYTKTANYKEWIQSAMNEEIIKESATTKNTKTRNRKKTL